MSNYTKSTNFATKDNLTPGDPLKIVRGTEIDTEFNNISTAIATKTDNSAAAITGGTITGITDLAIADGGTGASTATAAINNLLPAQTSAANKYLQSDGTNVSWDAVTLSTSDITGTLAVANGGTGVTSSTGTGNVVLSNSPTLVTPALGTPASGVATNLTGLPISTGVSGLGTGVATFLGTPSSANLISAVTDETGTGSLVFATSPTLVTPALGTPSALVGTNITGTASGLTAGNVTTNANLTGAVTSVGNATSLGSFTSAQLATALTDETGSGANVFATSPTLVTPILGTPTSATLTNATGLPLTTGVTGTLPTANGGTNLTSFTSGGVVYASSTSALATGGNLTYNGTTLTTTVGDGSVVARWKGTTGWLRLRPYVDATLGAVFESVNPAEDTYLPLTLNGSNIFISPNTAAIFKIGGSESMRLTTTGLGIGTSSPAAKLDVVGTGSNVGIKVRSGGNSGINLLDIADTAGANPMVLNPSGNLGVGTTSPFAGSITNARGAGVQASVEIAGNGTTAGTTSLSLIQAADSITYIYNRANTAMIFGTNNAERVRIDSSGNFLIGTTTSTAKSNITQTSAARVQSITGNSNTNGNAQLHTVVRQYSVVSLGTKLIIPFTSQTSLNSTTLCKIFGLGARYNANTIYNFEINFAVAHLNSLSNLTSYGGQGNYASIAINGMNIEITFTSAYTAATSDGVYVTIQYMTNNVSYSIDVPNIAMN